MASPRNLLPFLRPQIVNTRAEQVTTNDQSSEPSLQAGTANNEIRKTATMGSITALSASMHLDANGRSKSLRSISRIGVMYRKFDRARNQEPASFLLRSEKSTRTFAIAGAFQPFGERDRQFSSVMGKTNKR